MVAALRALLSPRQLAFVDDPYRFKILVAGRRGGKSYVDGAMMIMNCLLKQGTKSLYCGLTREASKNAIWPILVSFLDSAEIPHEIEISTLTIKFPNGSAIQVTGADVSNMKNRLRGQKFSLVVIDETGFYTGLSGLVEALLPALADTKGTLALTSSPGELLSGFFYEAYMGKLKSSWHQFSWDLRDNPHFMVPASDPSKYTSSGEEELDTICKLQFGGNRDHPAFRREYLGLYVTDDTHKVYPATAANFVPETIYGGQPSLGICLGPNGTFGAVVVEHSEYSRHINIKNSYVGSFSCTEDVEILRTWYNYSQFRVCNLGEFTTDVLQEISKRYELGFVEGTQDDKSFFQMTMRQDLVANYIRIKEDLPIIEEWVRIVRDSAGVEIDDGNECLMSDACLTLYRHIYTVHLKHFQPPPTTEDLMIESLVRQAKEETEDAREETEFVY
jgi:hypothetical protein